jgi:hypothetical protein
MFLPKLCFIIFFLFHVVDKLRIVDHDDCNEAIEQDELERNNEEEEVEQCHSKTVVKHVFEASDVSLEIHEERVKCVCIGTEICDLLPVMEIE